jgi:hypothetical protein
MSQEKLGRSLEGVLSNAIRNRRVITFTLEGCHRVAEPHDYGIVKGIKKLFFYQIGGASRSSRSLGWRWAKLEKISDLKVLERHFAGSRPALSGRHQRWDNIIASVSQRPALTVRASSARRLS